MTLRGGGNKTVVQRLFLNAFAFPGFVALPTQNEAVALVPLNPSRDTPQNSSRAPWLRLAAAVGNSDILTGKILAYWKLCAKIVPDLLSLHFVLHLFLSPL